MRIKQNVVDKTVNIKKNEIYGKTEGRGGFC